MTSKPAGPYILAVVGSLLVILLAYAFIFTPKINATAELDKKIAEAEITNGELQIRADGLAKKIAGIADAKSQVAEFNESFPAEPSQKELIAAILEAGASTRVTVTGINPAPPAAAAGVAPETAADPAAAAAAAIPDVPPSKVLAVVPLTINATGDAAALVVFMQRLEGLGRPFTATEVTLVRGDDGQSLLTLTGQSFIAAPLAAPAEQGAETKPAPASAAPTGETPAATAPAAPAPAESAPVSEPTPTATPSQAAEAEK